MSEAPTVEFDPFDLQMVNMFAARQRAVKEANGVSTRRSAPNSTEFELHYIGALGEYAVAKALGLKLDKRVHVGADDGSDLSFRGRTIQVKTFTFTGPNFQFFVNPGEFKADVAVAVQVLSPIRVRLLGWIERTLFEREASTRDYGHGKRLCVSVATLLPMEKFKQWVEEHDQAHHVSAQRSA